METFNKNPNKDFVVLNLTDLHMRDSDWSEKSEKLIQLQNTVDKLVEKTNPDLITISGDFTFAGNDFSYECYAKWLDSYDIPWAPVFGNHDNQNGPEYANGIAELFMSCKNCLFEKGEPTLGCGNYVVLIKENETPCYALFMIDSHDRVELPDSEGNMKKKWAHIYPEQMEWYEKEVKALGYVKNAIITHIPLYCYRYAFDAAWNKEYDPKQVTLAESFDEKYWNEGYRSSYGITHEGVNSHPIDTHEFDVIEKLGATDLIIVGHDHFDNFVIDYKGVTFAYSLKTGYGEYHYPDVNGGTIIKISSTGRTLEHIYI